CRSGPATELLGDSLGPHLLRFPIREGVCAPRRRHANRTGRSVWWDAASRGRRAAPGTGLEPWPPAYADRLAATRFEGLVGEDIRSRPGSKRRKHPGGVLGLGWRRVRSAEGLLRLAGHCHA